MTQTNSGGSPAGAAARHREVNPVQRNGTVYGVLELRIDALGDATPVPLGVRVRVDLADARWIDLATLERAARLTWGAAGVEVVGRHSGAIAEVVRYVRSVHERYALAEVEHAHHMARWGLGDAA
ncbi:hypothetical protein [Saccharothrix deserti]|uniref:hypothetical protein n=1 Tax=Saccharothrix deserti TaxID=2593674 RepID=UPI0013916CDB|nr:hypothetical protein [Saccharothrix deserti]